jgi:hypothetical protein
MNADLTDVPPGRYFVIVQGSPAPTATISVAAVDSRGSGAEGSTPERSVAGTIKRRL